MVTILPPYRSGIDTLFDSHAHIRGAARKVLSTWWAFRWFQIKHGKPFNRGSTDA